MATNDPHWIEHAHLHPGALTKKASAAGESPMGFAKQHKSDAGKTGKQSHLALILRGLDKDNDKD